MIKARGKIQIVFDKVIRQNLSILLSGYAEKIWAFSLSRFKYFVRYLGWIWLENNNPMPDLIEEIKNLMKK